MRCATPGCARPTSTASSGPTPLPTSSAALGIPEVTWHANVQIPFVNQVGTATIAAGLYEVVLARPAAPHRSAVFTVSALRDPFRNGGGGVGAGAAAGAGPQPDTIAGAVGYTAWASRGICEYGGAASGSRAWR